MCSSAVKTTMDTDCKIIVALTETGTAARVLAKYRPKVPILAVSVSDSAIRQMGVVRGVVPLLVESFQGMDSVVTKALATAKEMGMVKSGDMAVCIHGQNEHAAPEGPMQDARTRGSLVDMTPKEGKASAGTAASNLMKIVTVS